MTLLCTMAPLGVVVETSQVVGHLPAGTPDVRSQGD